jgi:hypothetical protein
MEKKLEKVKETHPALHTHKQKEREWRLVLTKTWKLPPLRLVVYALNMAANGRC